MKKVLLSAMLAASLLSASAVATAQQASSQKQADTAVKFRKAILQLVRSNMGPLGAMAKGNIPYDADVMNKNAMRIEQLGLMMEDYFALDTRDFDVKTGAKDEIWSNLSDFNSKAQDMVEAAATLQKVAQAQDADNYRKAIGGIGATCKACHDDYKKD